MYNRLDFNSGSKKRRRANNSKPATSTTSQNKSEEQKELEDIVLRDIRKSNKNSPITSSSQQTQIGRNGGGSITRGIHQYLRNAFLGYGIGGGGNGGSRSGSSAIGNVSRSSNSSNNGSAKSGNGVEVSATEYGKCNATTGRQLDVPSQHQEEDDTDDPSEQLSYNNSKQQLLKFPKKEIEIEIDPKIIPTIQKEAPNATYATGTTKSPEHHQPLSNGFIIASPHSSQQPQSSSASSSLSSLSTTNFAQSLNHFELYIQTGTSSPPPPQPPILSSPTSKPQQLQMKQQKQH